MKKNKIFSKPEFISIVITFAVLIAVAIPNFGLSLRRARDQVRRDDLGALVHALDLYYGEFGAFPPGSSDGKIMDCLKPGDAPYQDKKGNWVVNPIACEWGKDAFKNLLNQKDYMSILPREPDWEKGASYLYTSNGESYQIFASLEGKNEAEVDPVIIALGLHCGTNVCNMGRSYACDIPKTLAKCHEEALKLKK